MANASGSYTITVSHKGSLSGGSQNFSVIITGIQSNVVCNATVPTGLSASPSTNTAGLSWGAVAGASYQVRYRVAGGSWTTVDAPSATLSLTGLASGTTYEAQVRSVCSGSTSAYSAAISFTTIETVLEYCSSRGQTVSDEYISRVRIGSIDNTSTATNGYSDFTSQSTVLTRGAEYTISITPTWTGTVYAEAYAVWIDYNADGDFNDAGERVYARNATTSANISGTFTVPAQTANRPVTMRVSMKYNGLPSPCETFTYGEVEDYTVSFSNNSSSAFAANSINFGQLEMQVLPNPAANHILLSGAEGAQYKIINMVGATVMEGTANGVIDVVGLENGMYIVEANNGEQVSKARLVIKK